MTDDQAVQAGRDLFKYFSRSVNGFNDAAIIEGFKEELAREHRTLQQNMMRVLIDGFLKPMADKRLTNDFDMRNEASVHMAFTMVVAANNVNCALPYI